jgi:hypothetical protein
MSVELLKEAEAIFMQRGNQYGAIGASFNRAAAIATWITKTETEDYEVAMQMLAVKLARIANDPTHRDSYVDAINYLCIAFSLAEEARKGDRL